MMNSARIAVLLLAAAPVLASSYDPDQERAALRQAAKASYEAATRAAGLALSPERAADIKTSLDETLAQASLASNTAKNMEAEAFRRSAEMIGALNGRGAPAPAAAAKELSDGAAAARARWRALTADHDGMTARVAALPDQSRGKTDLAAALAASAASLAAAEDALGRAEAGASAAQAAVVQMAEEEGRARHAAEERSAASTEVSRTADVLPTEVAGAKSAVALLGQEPQGPNRTRAAQRLSVIADLANHLYSAADRACNRADDFRSRSAAFDRAKSEAAAALSAGAAAAAKAKAALDDADAAQTDVRSRLSRLGAQQ
jgi:hypothetical protein